MNEGIHRARSDDIGVIDRPMNIGDDPLMGFDRAVQGRDLLHL
jgi:hypothetical protein